MIKAVDRAQMLFTCFLILAPGILWFNQPLSAQTPKFLISPNQEVMKLDKASQKRMSESLNHWRTRRANADCSNDQVYGFPPDQYPPDQNFGFYHKDVFGEWFVVPADGTIDTVYFHTLSNVGPSPIYYPGSMDSTVYVRIFTSFITPKAGPGIRPGPYRPPCTSWGYWWNTGDDDQGVAAFREDATRSPAWIVSHTPGSHADSLWTSDSSWVPTNLIFGDWAPSFPPFGDAIWGLSGFRVDHIKPNSDVRVAMDLLEPLTVRKGDVIFIAFECRSSIHLDDTRQDVRFEIESSDQTDLYPSRLWKFYEHDSGPSGCAGITNTLIKRGWIPRGPLVGDFEEGATYNIWYAMTPATNIPPVVASVDQVHTTTFPAPQTVSASIYDCDNEHPSQAGVASAVLKYSVNNNPNWSGVSMTDSNDVWSGVLPGSSAPSTVRYYVVATDFFGLSDSSAIRSYRVASIGSSFFYRLDTGAIVTPVNISGTGTAISNSQWFVPPRSLSSDPRPRPGDDGTAGPFPIGGGFRYFGDTMRYVWIGVNGAIALSKYADDTIDVNDDGAWTDAWDIPSTQHHSRLDTLHEEGTTPKAFIAPYWANWIAAQDSPSAAYGHVRYEDDTDKFVVEWDSVGANVSSGPVATTVRFRVIMEKRYGTVEFQYDDIGSAGMEMVNLTGMEADSNYHPVAQGAFPPYEYYNKDGYPQETRLHNGLSLRYLHVGVFAQKADGWDFLSLPTDYPDWRPEFLFPECVGLGSAFLYNNGYRTADTITPGEGFWLKCAAGVSKFVGNPITSLDISVVPGWNLVGSIGTPLNILTITADPSTGIHPGTTPFFGYMSGYTVAASIDPGSAYWVRATGAGQMHLRSSSAAKIVASEQILAKMDNMTVSDRDGMSQTLYIGPGTVDAEIYRMPPPMPGTGFDVRFASDRIAEIYPPRPQTGGQYEYPVTIAAEHYPVTVGWQVRSSGPGHGLSLKLPGGKLLAPMNGTGRVVLSDKSVKRLVISLNSGDGVPSTYALRENYPNPFNPTTTIGYDVPEEQRVKLAVYNVLGQLVATLVDEERSAGRYSVTWDAGGMPSGVYFCRMEAGNFADTRKMVILK